MSHNIIYYQRFIRSCKMYQTTLETLSYKCANDFYMLYNVYQTGILQVLSYGSNRTCAVWEKDFVRNICCLNISDVSKSFSIITISIELPNEFFIISILTYYIFLYFIIFYAMSNSQNSLHKRLSIIITCQRILCFYEYSFLCMIRKIQKFLRWFL